MRRDYWPTKQWRKLPPEFLGMKKDISQSLDQVISERFNSVDGIVIIKNGYIAYEKYQNNYAPNEFHHVSSVTKSILSAAVGIALEKNYIQSLEQRVLDFFPEYQPVFSGTQKNEVTLRHLLTMTVPYSYRSWREPLEKLCAQPDWVCYALEQMGQGGKLGRFQYSSAGAHLLSAVITRTTGKNLRDFTDEFLFQPLGMQPVAKYELRPYEYEDLLAKHIQGWIQDPQGNSAGGWGLTLTLYDMARFGFLIINQGIWAFQEVVPAKWIAESTACAQNHYAYLWWVFEEDGLCAYVATGKGGNMICCIPQLDMVVAAVSNGIRDPFDLWKLIQNQIISAALPAQRNDSCEGVPTLYRTH